MTPPCLFGVIAFIFQEKRHEIALAILGQFSSVAEIVLGDMHSLCRICGWLASVHSSQFEDVEAVFQTYSYSETIAALPNE